MTMFGSSAQPESQSLVEASCLVSIQASESTFITDTQPGVQLVSGAAGWLKGKSSA